MKRNLLVVLTLTLLVLSSCTTTPSTPLSPTPTEVSSPTSTSTPTFSLTTTSPLVLSAPTLKSPTDGSRISSLPLTLEWQPSIGDASYGLQVATDQGFNNLIIEEKGLKEISYIVPLSKLNFGKTYYWRVGVGIAGGKSGWSQSWSFLTPTAPTMTPTRTSTPTTTPKPSTTTSPPAITSWTQGKYEPPDGQSYFGFVYKLWDLSPASANAPYGDTRPFSERIKDAISVELGGKNPTIIKVQTDWQTSDRSFLPFSDALRQINQVHTAVGSNVVPFLEWSSSTGSGDTNSTQPYSGITTKDVASGSLDNYIRQFARDIKKWGEPLFIRPIGGEFNYVYWKWCAPIANPQLTAADFVNAWRHTVDIFRQEGVTNVAWVWTPYPPPPDPSTSWKGDRNFESYYPGDDYVDWAGADNYAAPNWFDSLYSFSVAHQKPFFVAEWGARAPGSTMTHDQQNAWFEKMFNYFESHVKIKAILYFNYNWGNVNELTKELSAPDHVWLYNGQVNYQPNISIGDSRLIAGGDDQRQLFAQRINNQRYISSLVK